jgi:hypothetical protein
MNFIQTQSKTPLATLGLVLASSLGAIAFSIPAYSFNIDLSTFDSIGDVTSNYTVIQSGTNSTVITGGGTSSLEDFLGFTPGDFDSVIPGNTYASAIKKIFLSLNAGDQFSFDWNFSTSDSDQAFVSIDNAIQVLSGSNPYSYIFATSGNYQVAMGVLDVNDSTGPSTLTLSNVQLSNQAVPEPISILGSLIALGFGGILKRKF